MSKRSLILGAGQDASYLCDILIARGDEVHVLHRHSSVDNLARIRHCLDRVTLHRGDVTDVVSLGLALDASDPDEVYNVADQDNVSWSGAAPSYQIDVTVKGCDNVFTLLKGSKTVKVFQPLSVTMFGNHPPPHHERSPLRPMSPYACAKAACWHLSHHHRYQHGLQVFCGIMCNHDSPRRGPDYLLQQVCRGAVEWINRPVPRKIKVGSLDQQVDVGFARDYMEAAVAMLQLPQPDDFVIGTGGDWSIGEMCQEALAAAGWKGRFEDAVEVDPAFAKGPQPTYRADVSKAQKAFGFAPKHDTGDVIQMLVKHFQEQR